ncbi:MAG TPA: hypothetical protein VNS58_06675 [Puia sp.]|nr:hypothetical protein [Puia sp.]
MALSNSQQTATPIGDLNTPVHLRANNPAATLEATPPDSQPFPLNEGGTMPFNTSTVAGPKIDSLKKIIAFLGVSKPSHLRYQPGGGKTFCNIYVYDLAYLMGRDIDQYYIPRVWWTDAAVTKIRNGIPQIPSIGVTLREMTANDLHDWFDSFGGNFGWVRQNDLDHLQESVNSTGDIGVLVGKKAVGHGHITIVVPEQTPEPAGIFSAVRNSAGKVINPLQSQAGATNFEFGHTSIGGLPWFNTDGHVSAFYVFKQP